MKFIGLSTVIRRLRSPFRRTNLRRHRVGLVSGELLELRQLLTVTNLTAETIVDSLTNEPRVVFSWDDAAATTDSVFEVWVDQNFPNGDRNSKVFYTADASGPGMAFELQASHDLAVGQHTVYVRRDDLGIKDRWYEATFIVDDDGNPETPPNTSVLPGHAEISVVRQGQGSPGQGTSEGAVAWQGSGQLYDVWVNHRNASGRFQLFSLIQNVPKNNLSYREIADAANTNWRITYSDIDQTSHRQLETNDYRIFVREVNGAVDSAGAWIGRGAWSRGVNFSVVQLEGADAVPNNLTATNELRPVITWDPVLHAEAYVVSLWKGPDYQNHSPVNVLVHGTSYTPATPPNPANQPPLHLDYGNELYVRVRAVSSQGPAESIRAGNFASTVIQVPQIPAASQIAVPIITGPGSVTSSSTPVLRWQHSQNAQSYEVWFTSLETKQRVFLATGVTENLLHLHADILSRHAQLDNVDLTFDTINGLANGRYRFWVRPQVADANGQSNWSQPFDFEVQTSAVAQIDLTPTDPAEAPLTSPNLIKPYSANGQQHVLISSGAGESFGASVLARYVVESDGRLVRPVVNNSVANATQLQFPDLSMGTNIGDLEFYSSHLLLVLSRSSNEVRLVDLQSWEVISTYSLIPGTGGRAPDAIDIEVLDNGQILVVFNRSDRLRVLQVNAGNQIEEVVVAGASPEDQGFVLEGRAMHVSAVAGDNGKFTLFLATPTEPGIVIQQYDPASTTISAMQNADGDVVPAVVRNQFANPYVGGLVKSFADANGDLQQFFLSTERNGFLTWINVQTFAYGFVDLAEYLPHVSRDPGSCRYASPNDNSFDSFRIDDIDENTIIVSNGRQQSVAVHLMNEELAAGPLLDSSTSNSDRLKAVGGFAFSSGMSSIVLDNEDTRTLYTVNSNTSAAYRQNLQQAESGTSVLNGTWHEQFLNEFSPDIFLAQPTDSGLIVQRSDFSRAFVESRDDDLLELSSINQTFVASDGTVYQFGPGATAAYTDAATKKSYLAVSVRISGSDQHECSTGSHVLLLDSTERDATTLVGSFELPEINTVYNISFSADEIAVQDRVSGVMSVITNWRSATPEVTSIDFLDRQGRGFGGSRNGRTALLPDGTRVVLHDTVPDRVISVYGPGNIHSNSPLATVHAHNVGQWANDMEALDSDRVVYITWDANLVVLNVRTGIVETVQSLDTEEFAALDLYGSRELSVHGTTLSVTSPGRATVAVFDLKFSESAARYEAELTRVISAPGVVDSIVTENFIWVIESSRVRRYPNRF